MDKRVVFSHSAVDMELMKLGFYDNYTELFSGREAGCTILRSNIFAKIGALFGRVFAALIFLMIAPCTSPAQEADTSFVFKDLNSALKNPTRVYKLDLSKNGLKIYPVEISQFKNLKILNLSRNRIKTLPKEIGDLRNLESLNVSKNTLKEISPQIGEAKKLKTLILSRNNLTQIPTSIGDLSILEYLDLWDNNLSPLPDEIEKLKQLKTLDLRGILFNEEEHTRMKTLLPNTKIFLSPSCNCKN